MRGCFQVSRLDTRLVTDGLFPVSPPFEVEPGVVSEAAEAVADEVFPKVPTALSDEAFPEAADVFADEAFPEVADVLSDEAFPEAADVFADEAFPEVADVLPDKAFPEVTASAAPGMTPPCSRYSVKPPSLCMRVPSSSNANILVTTLSKKYLSWDTQMITPANLSK